MLVESAGTSRLERETLCQSAFERLGAAHLWVVPSPVAALYGLGRISGVVVDVGHEKTDVSAVLEGQVLPVGSVRVPGGVVDAAERLLVAVDGRERSRERERGRGENPGGAGGHQSTEDARRPHADPSNSLSSASLPSSFSSPASSSRLLSLLRSSPGAYGSLARAALHARPSAAAGSDAAAAFTQLFANARANGVAVARDGRRGGGKRRGRGLGGKGGADGEEADGEGGDDGEDGGSALVGSETAGEASSDAPPADGAVEDARAAAAAPSCTYTLPDGQRVSIADEDAHNAAQALAEAWNLAATPPGRPWAAGPPAHAPPRSPLPPLSGTPLERLGRRLEFAPSSPSAAPARPSPPRLSPWAAASAPSLGELAVTLGLTPADPGARKAVLECVWVVGGGSAIPGLAAAVAAQARAASPAQAPALPAAVPDHLAPGVSRHAAWTGAAVLAKVLGAQRQWVTRAEYNERGPAAVHRKCT